MVNKSSLLSILESMKSNASSTRDARIESLIESANAHGDVDMFKPNALADIGNGVTRYYSLYDGNPNMMNQPIYSTVPHDMADSILLRYFDTNDDRVIYVSEWIPIDTPPDKHVSEDDRFSITDYMGNTVDVTDIEWKDNLPTVNLAKLVESPDNEAQPANESGGFRLWYVMIEEGREAEQNGVGTRQDHKVCVLISPRKFPTNPFLDVLNKIPGASNVKYNRTTRSSYISIDIGGSDLRVIIMENSPEPIVHPSDDMYEIVHTIATKHNINVATLKSFNDVLGGAVDKLVADKKLESTTTEQVQE